tara:strand:+ start:2260 stop:2634 length:375 start_codon:yes stop_codon:yes gene_type:complete
MKYRDFDKKGEIDHVELKKIRKEMSLTQDLMADRLGMSKRMYCLYESGEIKIPVRVDIALGVKKFMPVDMTAFEKERIQRLINGIDKYKASNFSKLSKEELDLDYILKILRQCGDEFKNILTKT